jgi:cysteine-rich repeat protein
MYRTISGLRILAAGLLALSIAAFSAQSGAQPVEDVYCGSVPEAVEETFILSCDIVNDTESESVADAALRKSRALCRQTVNRVLSCQNGAVYGLSGIAKVECQDLEAGPARDDCERIVRQAIRPWRKNQVNRIAARDDCDAAVADAIDGECPICGDGILGPREECDDHNNVNGDGCNAVCVRVPICGDKIVDPGEQCDNGNPAPGDMTFDPCSGTCENLPKNCP